jgi:hypothetical protein
MLFSFPMYLLYIISHIASIYCFILMDPDAHNYLLSLLKSFFFLN